MKPSGVKPWQSVLQKKKRYGGQCIKNVLLSNFDSLILCLETSLWLTMNVLHTVRYFQNLPSKVPTPPHLTLCEHPALKRPVLPAEQTGTTLNPTINFHALTLSTFARAMAAVATPAHSSKNHIRSATLFQNVPPQEVSVVDVCQRRSVVISLCWVLMCFPMQKSKLVI